jgi:hypothetical protein
MYRMYGMSQGARDGGATMASKRTEFNSVRGPGGVEFVYNETVILIERDENG